MRMGLLNRKCDPHECFVRFIRILFNLKNVLSSVKKNVLLTFSKI